MLFNIGRVQETFLVVIGMFVASPMNSGIISIIMLLIELRSWADIVTVTRLPGLAIAFGHTTLYYNNYNYSFWKKKLVTVERRNCDDI